MISNQISNCGKNVVDIIFPNPIWYFLPPSRNVDVLRLASVSSKYYLSVISLYLTTRSISYLPRVTGLAPTAVDGIPFWCSDGNCPTDINMGNMRYSRRVVSQSTGLRMDLSENVTELDLGRIIEFNSTQPTDRHTIGSDEVKIPPLHVTECDEEMDGRTVWTVFCRSTGQENGQQLQSIGSTVVGKCYWDSRRTRRGNSVAIGTLATGLASKSTEYDRYQISYAYKLVNFNFAGSNVSDIRQGLRVRIYIFTTDAAEELLLLTDPSPYKLTY